MTDSSSTVNAAQDASHGEGHDYRKGSPHLSHPPLRAMVEEALTELVRSTIAVRGSCNVLEIGAGHGTFTDTLLTAGATVTVTEASRASADLLRQKYAGNPAVTVVYDATGEEVLDRATTYDGAACISVLHHIPDYLAFVRRLSGLVASGGWLYTVQDPLYYPRMRPRVHRLSRSAYYLWRIFQGNYARGLATRLRRVKGEWSEVEPSDLVEYHVMRDGVDELALQESLEEHYAEVDVFAYWSTQSGLLYRLGARTSLRTDFGLRATGRVGAPKVVEQRPERGGNVRRDQ